jgi:glycyl-tRNA synthetase (class II)
MSILSYYDEESKERFMPHVIEPSFGIDRTILAIFPMLIPKMNSAARSESI